ncbi:MAG TPA: hypothetical protein VG621_00315 [Candidatus Paceibacterota bacterium]|nr:hypothetical protein [Candidatus Paceibacterota bacterium]
MDKAGGFIGAITLFQEAMEMVVTNDINLNTLVRNTFVIKIMATLAITDAILTNALL